jgi:hypothetical protein
MNRSHPSDLPETHLPDLRFVPTESILPHEQHDPQRLEPLVRKIREESALKNPPVVTVLSGNGTPDARYVVLDGANRSTAARAAGFPHMVVQVVQYDDRHVRLTTWNHALSSYPHAELEPALGHIAGLRCARTDRLHARAMLARREALAWIHFDDDAVLALQGGTNLQERNALLNQVVDTYRVHGRFYRVEGDGLRQARSRHSDVTALAVFPHFEPAEILELAKSGDRLPCRHHAPPRALARAAHQRADRAARRHQALAREQERVARRVGARAARDAAGALLRGADGAVRRMSVAARALRATR